MELIALGDRGHDMVRAVTYERQSHKSETDSKASPQMQREKSIAYINSQENWVHVDENYADVGLSGYDPTVFRPGFERLMEDAKAGKFDVVVIYMLSRLTRQGAAEALRIQQELANVGVAIVSTQEPFINTSDDNPFGVAFFALIAGLAHQESKNKSKFIRDAFAALRAKGSHSSGPVPFGFQVHTEQVDDLTIRILSPGERSEHGVGPDALPADIVDFMIKEAEDGTAANAIARRLTDKHARTSLAMLSEEDGKLLRESAQKRRRTEEGDATEYEWSPTVVLRILRDPRLAGFAIGPVDPKTKRRTILRDENGEPVRPHTGFVEPRRWYALQALLDGRKPATHRDRTGERTLLGSWGVLCCSRCKSGMTVARTSGTYVCNLNRSVGKEPRHVLRMMMSHADRIIAERVWARLGAMDPSTPEDAEWLAAAAARYAVQGSDPEAAEELAEQEAQLEHVQQSIKELTEDRDAYVGPTARKAFRDTLAKYAAHEERCSARIAELTASATTSARLPVDEWYDAGDGDPFAKEGVWSRWGVDEKRSFIALFVDRVLVSSAAGKSGPPAELADQRIEIEWAALPDEDDEEVTS
jgi:DNA invertase Pin-like site-specific DNA recombinase